MLAINEMTADAMLGTPDSDLWHNVDDLLHNVNDLMSRLDRGQGDGESEEGEQEEGDGVFFTREAAPPSGKDEEAQMSAAAAYTSPHTEVQVSAQPTPVDCSGSLPQLWSSIQCSWLGPVSSHHKSHSCADHRRLKRVLSSQELA